MSGVRGIACCLLCLSACKPTEVERRCDAIVDRAVACNPGHGVTDAMQRSIREYCTVTLGERLRADDHDSLAYLAQQAMRELSDATDCATFGSASERHQCALVFRNQDDHDPQYMCFH